MRKDKRGGNPSRLEPYERVSAQPLGRCLRDRVKEYERHGLPVGALLHLMREGRLFNGFKPVREDDVMRAELKGHRPRPRHCFANAQRTVLEDEYGYATYFEGYVLSHGLLLHHAWLVSSGTAFDPTLEAADRAEMRAGRSTNYIRRRVYFGVPFTRHVVNQSLSGVRAFVPLLRIP